MQASPYVGYVSIRQVMNHVGVTTEIIIGCLASLESCTLHSPWNSHYVE